MAIPPGGHELWKQTVVDNGAVWATRLDAHSQFSDETNQNQKADQAYTAQLTGTATCMHHFTKCGNTLTTMDWHKAEDSVSLVQLPRVPGWNSTAQDR